jgi:phosphopantothenoylcysteine decarboxylase/phosphopantothenate--cysteine ligase
VFVTPVTGASDTSGDHRRETIVEEMLVCVGGSIAAAGIPQMVQAVLERRIASRVSIVLSERATHFVTPTTLAILAGQRCLTDLYEHAEQGRAEHVALARRCQLAVVAPATANIIGKLANGIVDCTISTVLSVFHRRIVLMPAMHPVTMGKPAFARNVARLQSDGYTIFGPVKGLSVSERSRDVGEGAMPAPDDVAAFLGRVAREVADTSAE